MVNTFRDLYSKFDQIGDFSNKTKFRNPVKEEEKKQSQPIYPIKKKDNEPIFIPNDEKQAPPFIINQSNYLENYNKVSTPQKTRGRPKINLTEEELKKRKSEENRKYRLKQKEKAEEKKKTVKEQFLMRENDNNINELGISPKKNMNFADLPLEDRRRIIFKSYYENLDKDKKKEEKAKRKVGYNTIINNQDDLTEYKQKLNNQRQEADEQNNYMTSYLNEMRRQNEDTSFI